MFDFAWSEIALIGIVALVAIGPKDLPVAIKAVAGMVKKARRMAGEFQVHVDEMVREADLHEVRREFNDLRRMDIKGKILSAVDGDGTIRQTMSENPLAASTTLTTPPPLTETAVAPGAEHVIPGLDAGPGGAAQAGYDASAHLAPAFAAPVLAAPASDVPALDVPAFVPPGAVALPAAGPQPAPAMIPPADARHPPLHG